MSCGVSSLVRVEFGSRRCTPLLDGITWRIRMVPFRVEIVVLKDTVLKDPTLKDPALKDKTNRR